MDSFAGTPADAPPSIKEITSRAEDFRFNINIPFKYWIQSCKTLRQEASFAMREGDFPRAYLMLYRESTIVMNYLRTHPEYKDRESRRLYKPLLEGIGDVVKKLETIKPIIQEQHDEYVRMTSTSSSRTSKPSENRLSRRRPPKMLDVADNVDLAVDLAQEELRKRDTIRRQTRPGDREGRVWNVPQRDAPGETVTPDDLRAQLEATRRTLDSVHRQPHSSSALTGETEPRPSSHTNHYYPPTSRSKPVDYVPERPTSHLPAPARPQRPPKELSAAGPDSYHSPQPSFSHPRHELDSGFSYDRPLPPDRPSKTPVAAQSWQAPATDTYGFPARPGKEPILGDAPAPSLPDKKLLPESAPDGDSTTQRVAFRAAAHLENGDPIRYVFLPSQLRSSFLEVAQPNTDKGLEMCGILCGTPVNNALFITTLIIPEQRCTSDTCETVNESGLLDYCIAEDLLMIGWIHTHPTQSCFMSSRDLHTQAGYQVMMPESIAIVCAPKFEPSYGIFRLTNPPGLPYILNCNQTDTFHHHPVDNIYTGAMRPAGHVHEVRKLGFKIHDLRP